jgi:hypothetical protein
VKIYAAGSKVPIRTVSQGVNSPDALAFKSKEFEAVRMALLLACNDARC